MREVRGTLRGVLVTIWHIIAFVVSGLLIAGGLVDGARVIRRG